MKKINKKQKLIIAISIVLLLIILAIIFTSNIISNKSKLASGGYFATTANAGSALVASYIREGITIGGITGTLEVLDTSDATATAEDIAWGKTGYVNGKKITGTRIPDSNYDFKDSLGNVVKVPAGFKVVNPEDNVTDGIVIEDVSALGKTTYTKGSQFVWIPVGDVKTNEEGSITTITLGRYTFAGLSGKETLVQSAENWNDTSDSIAIETYYKELSTSSYGNITAKNLSDFITKATISGGYYIGRYEAGDALATDSARTGTDNVSNPNSPLTCKSGVYPYNYVNQGDASRLAKEMYSSSDFDSDLINSYAWDTAIVFIQTFSGCFWYSVKEGYSQGFSRCGESLCVDGPEQLSPDMECNIYDMSTNVREFSTETCIDGKRSCTVRGGTFMSGVNGPESHGGVEKQESTSMAAFRPILYL